MKTLLFGLFLLIACSLSAQNPVDAKTIFELYNLPKEGCTPENGIFAPSEQLSEDDDIVFEDQSIDEGDYGDNRPKPDQQKLQLKFQETLNNLPALLQTNSKWSEQFENQRNRQDLKSGNYCFRENGLWGLKSAKGKILIPPTFRYIKTDTIQHGFMGFAETTCNYYSGKKGKKLLESDYFQVRPLPNGHFIVQTASGYGLISAKNEWIIKPENARLSSWTMNDKPFYTGQTQDGRSFLQFENEQEPLFIKNIALFSNPVKFLNDEFMVLRNLVINLKTKKQLLCEPGFKITPLGADIPLVTIRKNNGKKTYLIDLNGNIINQQEFAFLKRVDGNKNMIVEIYVDPNNPKRWKTHSGLINLNGAVLIEPIYKKINYQKGIYWLQNEKLEHAIADASGNIVLPFKKATFMVMDEHLVYERIIEQGTQTDRIIQVPEGNILKEGTGYFSMQEFKCGNQKYFLAIKRNASNLYNAQFEEIFPKPFYGIHHDREKILAIERTENKQRIRHIYDCDCKKIEFEIDGKKTDRFQQYRELPNDVTYVTLENGSSWLITPDGTAVTPNETLQAYTFPLDFKDFYVVQSAETFKYGLVNLDGQIILPIIFENISKMKGGEHIYYRFDKNNHGFFTQKGKGLLKNRYREYGLVNNELIKVSNGGLWGVINIKEEIIVPMTYRWIIIDGGLIKAGNRNTITFFDFSGKEVYSASMPD